MSSFGKTSLGRAQRGRAILSLLSCACIALGGGRALAQSDVAEPAIIVPPDAAPPAPLQTEQSVDEGSGVENVEPGAPPVDEPQDALAAGLQRIALTERQFGKNSLQSAEAYTDLAEAQRRAGDHDAAETSFLEAIEIYRAVDGPFTPLAIAPLTSLGDNYHEAGRYLNAVSAYSEARTVSRRIYGLLNERQIDLLDRVSRSLVEINQPVEADEHQREALRIIERNWPPESEQALAGIYKYADWLRQRGLYQLERDQYARALRIIREHYGKDDARQVEPLIGIGNSFRSQRIPEGQGAGALNDALALLVAEPVPDKLALAGVLRDLGDWEIAFNKVGYDGAEYRRAWQLLGEIDEGEQLRAAWFTGPNYVLREPISLRGLSENPDAPSGHVLVRFDLDTTGQSANVAVVESEPAGLKDEAVLRHIRRSRFRPQMANGGLIPGEALALQFNFRYTPDAMAAEESDERRD